MINRLTLLACIVLVACTASQTSEQRGVDESPIVWPSPPAKQRILFKSSFNKPVDLGVRQSIFRRVADALAGTKENAMVRPYAIAVHKSKILVADPGLHGVHFFDTDRKIYRLISVVEDEPLSSPVGVALGENRIFISDSVLSKVFILNEKGDLLSTISSLERPTGLAFDSDSNRLYVAETLAHRILIFNPEGVRLFEFGERGVGNGKFNFPSHIFLSDNQLLVNDSMNFRIQAFDFNGRFLSLFGHHGSASGYFSQPKGVAADRDGHIYVAGATIDRIQIFSPEGVFLLAFGQNGSGHGEFVMPTGIAIVNKMIYVADSYNNRIQIFEYVGSD